MDDQADQALAMLRGAGWSGLSDHGRPGPWTGRRPIRTPASGGWFFWESAYHYLLGPDLAEPLERQPVGAAALSTHLEKKTLGGSSPWIGIRRAGGSGPGIFYIYVDAAPVEIPGSGPPQNAAPGSVMRSRFLVSWGGLRLNREDILDYWSAPMDGQNRTEEYLKPVGRSIYLRGLIEKILPAPVLGPGDRLQCRPET